jgi:predicted DNA-binding transcriptional regulator YafY
MNMGYNSPYIVRTLEHVMYHPTTRVLTILEMLQARPGLSGAAIAKQLEVDRRTVRRYITMLQELGIPIETTRGLYGGYRLRPGFKLPPLMLTDDEALAVTLSLIAAQRHGMSLEPAATAGALAKIERVLPYSLQERLQAVRDVLAFTVTADVPRPTSVVLMQLSLAIQRAERVQLWYQSGAAQTERSVDPYGLVFHWGRWYLAAWCHLRQAIRVFRLDRVTSLSPVPETFSRPVGFDSLTVVMESLAMAPWGWEVVVLLETTLETVEQQLPPGWAILEEVAGGILLRGQYDRLDWIAAQLLLLNCPLTVRQPQELIEALRVLGERASALSERWTGILESGGSGE